MSHSIEVTPEQLSLKLDQRYHSMIESHPVDGVEQFINKKLYEFATRLESQDPINQAITHKKLDSILSMSKEQRLALAISDMQKRGLSIPLKYQHLKLQDEGDLHRDLIISAADIKTKLMYCGLLSCLAGIIIGAGIMYLLLS